MAYMGLSYDFASFLITNLTAIKVYQFFESCVIPEKHFYAVLSAIPGVPGGFYLLFQGFQEGFICYSRGSTRVLFAIPGVPGGF